MLREQLLLSYFLLCLAHHHNSPLMQSHNLLLLAMDHIAERTTRVLGRNAGTADGVFFFTNPQILFQTNWIKENEPETKNAAGS
jgi:hypothetical protein